MRLLTWTLGMTAGLGALYALALPLTVQGGDSGEMTTVMLAGGIPHPPGYPWQRALGPLCQALVVAGLPAPTAAAVPSAVFAIVGFVGLFHLCARWVRTGVAATAVGSVALSPLMLLHVPDAEVWGLVVAWAVVVLWTHLGPRPTGPGRSGFVLGLAMSHHLSLVLLAPLVGPVLFASTAPEQRPRAGEIAKRLALAAAGFAAGLSPYLTLLIDGGGAWRWGNVGTFTGFVRHVLRADYGVFDLSLRGETPGVLVLWGRAVHSLGTTLTGGLVDSAVFGFLALAAIGVTGATAWRKAFPNALATTAYGLSLAASAVAFPALHNIDPGTAVGAFILERFDILTAVLCVAPLALALDRMVSALQRTGAIRGTLEPVLFGTLATSLLAHQTYTAWSRGVPRSDRATEGLVRALLDAPPPGHRALILGTGDHRLFISLYLQSLDGHRTDDVLYVDASLLSQPWYRRELRKRWPELPDVERPVALVQAILDDPARRRTPLFVTDLFSRPVQTLPRVPYGPLWRIFPPHEGTSLTLEAVTRDHLAAWSRVTSVSDDDPRPHHVWSAELRQTAAAPSAALASQLENAGLRDLSQAVRATLDAKLGLQDALGGP